MKSCTTAFLSEDPRHPPLACGKGARPHLVHHDPATGIRYIPHPRGVFDLCGLVRHRPDCPLRPGRDGP